MEKQEMIKKVLTVVVCIAIVICVGAIWDSWNTMWYEFGQNVYNLLH